MIAAVAVALSTTAMAQENNRGGQRMDKTEMAQRRTEMMAQRYGLNDTQKAQLLELNTKYSDMMPMRRGGGSGHRQRPPQANNSDGQTANQNVQSDAVSQRPERAGQGRGHRPGNGGRHFDPEKMKEYEAGLKNIMTSEQYEKYEADKKNRPQRPQRPQND